MHLPIIYKRNLRNLITTITINLISGLILGVFFSGIVIRLAQSLFNLNLSIAVLYPVIMLGTVVWFINLATKGWFWEFRLEETQIYLKKLTGKIVTLPKNDIKNVLEQNNKVVFEGIDTSLTLHFYNLPMSLRFATMIALNYWLPTELLPPEIKETIERINRLASETPLATLAEPVEANVTLQHIFAEPLIIQILFVLGMVILACLFLAFFAFFNLIWLLVSLIPLAIVILFLWNVASTSIELRSDGIYYRRGLGSKFFKWDDIQVVVIAPRVKIINIWTNGWYSGMSLLGLKAEKFAFVQEMLLGQVYQRRIPMGYSEKRF